MPLAAKSSGDHAYDAVLTALRSGTFAPGDRLREDDVAARLALSRTPVREAIRRLESDGIIEHRPRVGAIIRRLSRVEVVELYEMRIVLECTAARMAAKHGGAAEFDALEALNDRIDAARETPTIAAALNLDFHKFLYQAARNRFLTETARALNGAVLLLGPTTYDHPGRMDTVLDQHRAIINALRNGDTDKAAAATRDHLEVSLRFRLMNFPT